MMMMFIDNFVFLGVQRIACRSPEVPLGGDDVTERGVSLATPGGSGGTGTLSQLVHRATMLAVCVSAVTSYTCITSDARVDVIVSLPHLFVLRTFHCLFEKYIVVSKQPRKPCNFNKIATS